MHGHFKKYKENQSNAWTCLHRAQAHAKPMLCQDMSNVAMVPGGCCDDSPHNNLRSQGLPHIIQQACNMPSMAMAKLDTHGQA